MLKYARRIICPGCRDMIFVNKIPRHHIFKILKVSQYILAFKSFYPYNPWWCLQHVYARLVGHSTYIIVYRMNDIFTGLVANCN